MSKRTFRYRYLNDEKWSADMDRSYRDADEYIRSCLIGNWKLAHADAKTGLAYCLRNGQVTNTLLIEDITPEPRVLIYDKNGLTTHKTLGEATKTYRNDTGCYKLEFSDEFNCIYRNITNNELFPFHMEVC